MPIYHGNTYASTSTYTTSPYTNYATSGSVTSGICTSGGWGTYTYTFSNSAKLGPPTFYDTITSAQGKYLQKKKNDLNLTALCQNVFGSPFLFIEKLVTPMYTKEDYYKRSLSALLGEDKNLVAAVEASVNEFNQLLTRALFQATNKVIRSIKDGEVIREIMDNRPNWIIVSGNLAGSFNQDLTIMETYGIQHLTKVTNKGFNVDVYGTIAPDTDRAFIMAGNKSNVQFRYNIPYTILNGHLVSTSHFHVVNPEQINIYLSEEFQNVNSIA